MVTTPWAADLADLPVAVGEIQKWCRRGRPRPPAGWALPVERLVKNVPAVVIRPMALAFCSVNQRLPSGPTTISGEGFRICWSARDTR